ncbi:Ankyrin repeat domain-containing protein 42 [Aphanomyces cochlioides]|nr:Ankyrin repeat domain-containing protein 42 [Aphanomyces cochlioides]
MGSAPTSLRVHEEFRRYFRTWDIMDVTVARMKYRQLTLRFCINMEQLAIVLGRQLPDPLVSFVFELFAPKPIREPRSVPVVDAVEVFVGLILVCQATLGQRIAFIFDLMDSRGSGQLSESELSICK